AAQHNARKVSRHVLTPQGATFISQDHDFVTSADPDFHPADVLEAGDGTLLVLDTGSWYVHHCPTGQIRKSHARGGVYRIRPQKWPPPDDRWGLKVAWARPAGEIVALLADSRPAVRDRARQVLVRRGREAVSALRGVLTESNSVVLKQQAAWA